MTSYASGQPPPPPAGGNGGRRARDPSVLSRDQLTELHDCAIRLRAAPVHYLTTDERCLDALIDRLGALITGAGGRPQRATLEHEWVRDTATLTHQRLTEIRRLASRLRDSPAVTPADITCLNGILTQITQATTLRRDREEFWAERGEPMPGFLTHQD